MGTEEPELGAAHAVRAERSLGGDADHYTGVVLIHGIGDEKRNETLQEAVNALTYWFNQKAGLALRPEGPGRVWVSTELTIDNNPDAQASRATIELEPPAALAQEYGALAPLRLEFREVWWAQSFGVPRVGSALKWARLQVREEATRVLLPLRTRLDPVYPGVSPPATHAPSTPAYGNAHPRRALLHAVLGVYGALQYVWKLIQWLVLTPLIYLLLILVSAVKLLALIPFLQSGIIGGLSRVVGYISLHWIAPLQVYLQQTAGR